jgi:hypothetical protein
MSDIDYVILMIEEDINELQDQVKTVVDCFELSNDFDELRACVIDRMKPMPPTAIHEAIKKSAMRKP